MGRVVIAEAVKAEIGNRQGQRKLRKIAEFQPATTPGLFRKVSHGFQHRLLVDGLKHENRIGAAGSSGVAVRALFASVGAMPARVNPRGPMTSATVLTAG